MGRVGAGLPQASDPLGSARGVPEEVLRRLRRSGKHSGRESRRRSFSPAVVLGAIPAVTRAGVTSEGLGKLPGTEVELMRGLAMTEMQQGDRTTAGQRARCGGARR
jgi:hypothetical protein